MTSSLISFSMIRTQVVDQQAEKFKSREMKEGWMKKDEGWMKDEGWRMKDEWRRMKDERWMMKDDDFKLFRGFEDRQTDRQTLVIVESLSRLKMTITEGKIPFLWILEKQSGSWSSFYTCISEKNRIVIHDCFTQKLKYNLKDQTLEVQFDQHTCMKTEDSQRARPIWLHL